MIHASLSPGIDPRDDPRAFRDALGAFPTGVCVVTCLGAGGPVGITANSFASLSLSPPLILWSPSKHSRRGDVYARADRFALHVLAADQEDVARAFVKDGQAFGAGAQELDGLPLLAGCAARFVCDTHSVLDGGDHHLILGEVRRVERRDTAPLVFANGSYARLASPSAGARAT